MTPTNIGWSDFVHNSGGGCARVSPGCENCWAETLSPRLAGMGQKKHAGLTVVGADGRPRWSRESVDWPDQLAAPLKVKAPKRIFWFSMSDLFYERRSFEYIAACFGVMAASPWHTHQVLTKRPARALEFFRWLDERTDEYECGTRWRARAYVLADCYAGAVADGTDEGMGVVRDAMIIRLDDAHDVGVDQSKDMPWPLPNVHLGVTCEDQQRADERIPLLLQCPAAVRWVSAEPLLEPVNLRPWLGRYCGRSQTAPCDDWMAGRECPLARKSVRWVVVGGETGEGRREVAVSAIEDVAGQCAAAGVRVFVKQDAGKYPGRQGRISDATWALKQFPEAPPASAQTQGAAP